MSLVGAVEPCASVRRFCSDAVPRSDVERMVELAMRTEDAGNTQMWRFIAIEDSRMLSVMREAVDMRFEQMVQHPSLEAHEGEIRDAHHRAVGFADAPLCIAVLCVPYRSRIGELLELAGVGHQEHERLHPRLDLQSVGAATQLLITAAHAMGYGACWTSAPVVAAELLEELLGIKPPERLVALVSVGRPAEASGASWRMPARAVLSFR
jgi:coenzyme F420-0:L-glutamate ligase / coenzyme F420-1:gamma-L-glutamate ligase